MRLEDIKYEFPEMPQEIKDMVKSEVEKQLHTADAANADSSGSTPQTGKESDVPPKAPGTEQLGSTPQTGRRPRRRMSARRAAIIGLAAAMALGTTAFAGSRIYKMYSEQLGNYGAKTLIAREETESGTGSSSEAGSKATSGAISGTDSGSVADTVSGTGSDAVADTVFGAGSDAEREAASQAAAAEKKAALEASAETEIPDVSLNLNYLPEGMKQQPLDSLKFHYESDTALQGGISICGYSMDTGDDSFQVTDTRILSREEFSSSGHDMIYLEKQLGTSGETQWIVYVFFPEVHHVLQMWCESDVTKEEAVKVAEGIELLPLKEGEASEIGLNLAWSSYLASQQDTGDVEDDSGSQEAALQEIENAHGIGEAFPLLDSDWDEDENKVIQVPTDITVNVVSVQTADDLSLLGDSPYIDSGWLDALDDDGKLLPNEIQYIKQGDGINTLNEIVKTEQVPQKLVYATIDYTNTGDTALEDILFMVNLIPVCKTGEGYQLYERAILEENDAWDATQNTGAVHYGEMQFYDCHSSGGHNGSNYIDVLNPGETVTIHTAWIANEDELQYLYLNFNVDSYDPSGLVDIRQ